MEQNDLAKEYAKNLYHERADGDFKSTADVFDSHDIEDAFNAGRESVVDNIPDLEWKESLSDGETYWLAKPMGGIYMVSFVQHEYKVFYCYNYIACAISLSSAKQMAHEDYKQRIKQALGL